MSEAIYWNSVTDAEYWRAHKAMPNGTPVPGCVREWEALYTAVVERGLIKPPTRPIANEEG